jgi:Uncharacterised nucleotidyltransferase
MARLEEDFLITACLEPLSRAERDGFIAVAQGGGLDWALVLELARLNKVEPRLTHVLEGRGLMAQVPAPVAEALRGAAAVVERANRQRVVRACELFAELRAAEIEVCVLKGVLFAETIYRDPLYKRMNDVDLLVRRDDLARLPGVYRRLGYFPIAERVGDRPELNQKVSHHLPPYVHRELDCVLGTQWGLKSPLAGLKIDYDAIWSRSEPYSYRGLPVRKLSSRDNLFHVCVHLGLFKSGLRDLMDIANLIRSASEPIDWQGFVADVRRARAQSHAVHALSLVQCIDPRPETAQALATLVPEARGFYLRAARKKSASRSVALRTCSGHLTEVENAVTAFNMARRFPEKARLMGDFMDALFCAPAADARRLAFEPEPSEACAALARVQAPVQILRAIGAEIGAGLLAGLFVKSALDLGVALARWPFTPPGDGDLEAWARSAGLSLADLKRLKTAVY